MTASREFWSRTISGEKRLLRRTIKRGEIGGYMPFYPQGHAVRLG